MRKLDVLFLFVFAGLAASACAFIDDFGRFEIVEGDGQVDGELPNLDCVDHVLEGATVSFEATTAGPDRRSASCGGVSAPEKVFQWSAPYTDFFRFHTSGSDFETVLSLIDDDCDGAQLDCSDLQDGTYRSEIVRRLEDGHRVIIVADGRSGDSGNAVVNVEPVSCPEIQLTQALLPVAHTTTGRDHYAGMTCTAGEHVARSYRFTAPSDGHYSFLAKRTQAGWRPAIRVEEGPICGGVGLQCGGGGSDNISSLGSDGRAEVLRHLTAGEHVTLVVSGFDGEGSFELDVARTGHATCIDHTLTSALEVTLAKDGPHRMTNSCGQASVTDFNGTLHPQPDLNVRVELPPPPGGGCFQSCGVHVETGFRFSASVAELDSAEACAGRELSCVTSNEISFDPPAYDRFIDIPSDGKPKVLTIDRRLFPYQGGAYYDPTENQTDVKLTLECAIACF